MRRRVTKEELAAAVAASSSLRQVLIKLGKAEAGGNYETLKRQIAKHGFDTSHFSGQAWNKGHRNITRQRPLSDYLEGGVPISSNRLRQRLLREEVLPYRCNGCGLTSWRGRPIPLELEHKDGDHSNNRLENLELLCPNCHAQTATYRGRNMKRAA